jgi:uncharacterized protein (TIGR00369 family)
MDHVRDSFARQKAMSLIGASLASVDKGESEIRLPYRADLTQQKGFVHGGIIGMIADSAAGYAAYSLMPRSASLVTVEYKMNILAPARGALTARGRVIKSGRTLTVARAEVYADDGTHVASMQQTLMMLPDTSDHPE